MADESVPALFAVPISILLACLLGCSRGAGSDGGKVAPTPEFGQVVEGAAVVALKDFLGTDKGAGCNIHKNVLAPRAPVRIKGETVPIINTSAIAKGDEEKLVAVRAVTLSEDHPDRASGGFYVLVSLACWQEAGGERGHPMHMFIEYRMYWTRGKFQIAEKKIVLE